MFLLFVYVCRQRHAHMLSAVGHPRCCCLFCMTQLCPSMQVLPLVEAFFVMCDARAEPQAPPSSPLQTAMSAELSMGATPDPSSSSEGAPQQTPQQTPASWQHAHGGASAPSQPVAESHAPFLR